jgi:hypothetical protein
MKSKVKRIWNKRGGDGRRREGEGRGKGKINSR